MRNWCIDVRNTPHKQFTLSAAKDLLSANRFFGSPGRALASLLLATLLIGTPGLAAQPPAGDLLRNAYAAETTARLAGTITTALYANGRSAAAKIKIFRSGVRTRMEYVTGPSAGMVVIDDGESMIKLSPADRIGCACSTPDPPEHLDLLLSNYRPAHIGTDKIAGRECHVLSIQPKQKGNPFKKLWMDKRTNVILKTERYGSDGKLVTLTRYDQVDFSAHPGDSLFEIPRGWNVRHLSTGQGRVRLDLVRKAMGFTPVKPGYIPRGYSFDGHYLQQTPCLVSVATLRYTNGLNTISVFERKCPCKDGWCCPRSGRGHGARRGRAHTGACMLATNPHAKIFQARRGDLVVVVVGDAPETELRKMADSFK